MNFIISFFAVVHHTIIIAAEVRHLQEKDRLPLACHPVVDNPTTANISSHQIIHLQISEISAQLPSLLVLLQVHPGDQAFKPRLKKWMIC